MDINFYSDLSDGCAQNVDSEFLDSQGYGGYSEDNKVMPVFTNGYAKDANWCKC